MRMQQYLVVIERLVVVRLACTTFSYGVMYVGQCDACNLNELGSHKVEGRKCHKFRGIPPDTKRTQTDLETCQIMETV